MHVHLDEDRCLEVIVMRGRADRLQAAAEKLFATRGVLQGSIEVVAVTGQAVDASPPGHAHGHGHTHRRRPPRAPRTRAKL
jgi:CopG family nickel-responsive transcriptional regulator